MLVRCMTIISLLCSVHCKQSSPLLAQCVCGCMVHSTRHLSAHPWVPSPWGAQACAKGCSVEEQKGVIYCVPCDGCPKKYIGQTGRTLKHQLVEHRHALKKGDAATSALAEHTLETGHPVGLSKVEVIDYHPFTTDRCLLESWYIQRTTDTLNRERGTLPTVYTALLD